MGSAASSLRAAGRQAGGKVRTLPAAPTRRDQDVLAHIEALEQARLREQAASGADKEDINAKDEPLDQLLSKLSTAVRPQTVDIRTGATHTADKGAPGTGVVPPHPHPSSPATTSGFGTSQANTTAAQASSTTAQPGSTQGPATRLSAKDRSQPIPEYTPTGRAVAAQQGASPAVPDEDQGRVQAFVLRELLEAKNAAEAEGRSLDLTPYIREHGLSADQLQRLFSYCAIPRIGTYETHTHEYKFARPPPWWLQDNDGKGSKFKSEQAVLEATTGTPVPRAPRPPPPANPYPDIVLPPAEEDGGHLEPLRGRY